MDLIVKKASSISDSNKIELGIVGIPNDWPVESYPYVGIIPDGFIQMTSEEFTSLKENNQSAYDAWVQSKRPIITLPPIAPLDTDNAPVVRPKFAPFGTTYQYHCYEFTTSLLGSIFHKDVNLNEYIYTDIKYYKDENNTECTDQIDADLNCIKTVVYWEPPFDYEIIGGGLLYYGTINQDIRAYVIGVPDVPSIYGGNKLLVTNCNLRYLGPNGLRIDGRATKRLLYNANYHTNKLQFVFRHPAGYKLCLQTILELYIQ